MVTCRQVGGSTVADSLWEGQLPDSLVARSPIHPTSHGSSHEQHPCPPAVAVLELNITLAPLQLQC